MKIRPSVAQLLHGGGQMDRHDEASSGFSQFCESINNFYNPSVIHFLCSCNPLVCAADSSCFFTVS